jgi:hypothetical protein
MHATTASPDEWDEYEWKYCRSIERYAREQPDDPDVPAMVARIRAGVTRVLRWAVTRRATRFTCSTDRA